MPLPREEVGGTRKKNSDDMHVSHLLPLWAIPVCGTMLAGTVRERRQLGVYHGLELIVWQLEEKATGKNELLKWVKRLNL